MNEHNPRKPKDVPKEAAELRRGTRAVQKTIRTKEARDDRAVRDFVKEKKREARRGDQGGDS